MSLNDQHLYEWKTNFDFLTVHQKSFEFLKINESIGDQIECIN